MIEEAGTKVLPLFLYDTRQASSVLPCRRQDCLRQAFSFVFWIFIELRHLLIISSLIFRKIPLNML
ncbi:hypothetical protein STRMA_0494 [Streptococcus macacae NCTC 11558]|uniref:Uncharacterized protein n=1 Tax=Streptococcus macacae NCTC 11558 TaxID=764298 RepID=G5JZ77_9STRE|nr:hypothetical protein STRMA_0494 [Streptococcus macacae NCTC 11558]